MSDNSFNALLALIHDKIKKRKIKRGIGAEQRLCITLRYLAHGDSMQSLAWLFQIGKTTVRDIIYTTCEAIWDSLKNEYLKLPHSIEEWKAIAKDFEDIWNFPHCLGALDGKHVSIQAPPNSGSAFFNYKKHFSTVLMSICNANYRFIMVDVGSLGSASDGGIFHNMLFKELLEKGHLNIPPPEELENTT
ncbi:protein ANTAGONIST OF LIKE HETEROCHROMATIN PROTEIN 1-like [Sitophilus oryzae]|uniref:Protein ANTAGONIST OF LIKE HETEROCHROMATIN PROTEIN 1-like n=1 Tax=Sitophilus oryzae TaxID=7048 RepID=A0A6J2YGK2_SITOR|nr:protein ANTAGONIST OF LIKE HETEROCHROMATIN PROTEIN 1-like [Sitophilus oryzae]